MLGGTRPGQSSLEYFTDSASSVYKSPVAISIGGDYTQRPTGLFFIFCRWHRKRSISAPLNLFHELFASAVLSRALSVR